MRLFYSLITCLATLLPLAPARAQSREEFRQQTSTMSQRAAVPAPKVVYRNRTVKAAPAVKVVEKVVYRDRPVMASTSPAYTGPSFTTAAVWNDKVAIFNLGYQYDAGKGVPQDYARAMQCYQRGAELGNTKAMSYIGLLYEDGHGVARNYQQAMAWHRQAADAGDAAAMARIALAYDLGEGVNKDACEAVRWYHKAADANDIDSMITMGRLYSSENNKCATIQTNIPEARRWYTKAIELGSRSNHHMVQRAREMLAEQP